MSSEESYEESGIDGTTQKALRIRGPSWRSMRLQRLYEMFDEEEFVDRSLKPKRGVGRMERCLGPPKDGVYMPPKGIASWMVSRRWLKRLRDNHPELVELLDGLVVDPPGFDWGQFTVLGVESDSDGEMRGDDMVMHANPELQVQQASEMSVQEPRPLQPYVSRSEASSELRYALVLPA